MRTRIPYPQQPLTTIHAQVSCSNPNAINPYANPDHHWERKIVTYYVLIRDPCASTNELLCTPSGVERRKEENKIGIIGKEAVREIEDANSNLGQVSSDFRLE